MNLRIFDTVDDLHRAAAGTILQRVGGRAAAVALSGGTTPEPLYRLLAQHRDELARVKWVLVDERYVPRDDPRSNAAMIERALGMPLVAFDTTFADPADSARAFEAAWDIERLDLALLGCGEDGHTASLFPGTRVLEVEDRIASEVFVPQLDQWRVTLTKPVLRAAALRIVLAPGEKKKKVIEQVRAGADHPVAQVTNGVESWWFIDR